jgi:hypothetical protein
MLFTIGTEERHQKPKRLSYTAKFKREVVWCTEETGNCKAAAVFVKVKAWLFLANLNRNSKNKYSSIPMPSVSKS